MRPKTRHFLRTTLWIYISLIWTWFALRLAYFDDRFWWLSLLNTHAFYFLIPSLILLPVIIQRRQSLSKLAIIGLMLPGLLSIWFWGYLMLPPTMKQRLSKQPQTESKNISSIKIRAMSFNILFSNQNYNQIANTIRNANPDIIGLQEAQPHHIAALKQALPEYPYIAIHPTPKFHNIALLSRYPLTNGRSETIESLNILPATAIERGLSATITIQNRPITIIVAHLTPNYVPPDAPLPYPEMLQSRYTSRHTEIDYLLNYTRNNPHPSLILCDCNLTNTSQAYPQMTQGLSDSFAHSGWGLGHTFVGETWKFPLQRLDYIWHTKNLPAIESHVGQDGGSDHLPIVSDFQL